MPGKKRRVLLVEDDEGAAFGYRRYLSRNGYDCETVTGLKEARECFARDRLDAVVLDLRLPDGNSLEWIPEIRADRPSVPVVVITGMDDIATAVQATKAGADNFLTKPVQLKEVKQSLDKALEIRTLRKRNLALQRMSRDDEPYFGTSDAVARLVEYASVAADNDTVLLIQGETGTGKGVLARWIHEQSERKEETFVELNCSSLKGELLRSELFGHLKGSFTSAHKDREGMVEVADGGTLFLDEVGDMDLEVQAQLLKTIEEKSFRRVGENKPRTSNFRLICATNKDLLQETERGRFRKDLYYRICVFPIDVPALKERREDIPALAEHLLRSFSYKHLPLDPAIVELLQNYSWPGNIRELRNVIERAMLLARGGPIAPEHLVGLHGAPAASEPKTDGETLELAEIETRHIHNVLHRFKGDKNRASEALGISLSSLYRRLGKLQVPEHSRD